MCGYNQYCSIARGAEIFATRWTPIIVRNLLMGCSTFGEILSGAPGVPRSLLSQRLRELEQHEILVRRANPAGRGWLYELTDAGRELALVCDALGTWASRWSDVGPEHLDPYVALWGLCKGIHPDELPPRRVTVRFDVRNVRRAESRFWLLVQKPEPELCVKPPGFQENLIVDTDPRSLVKWRLGELTLGRATRSGAMSIEGPRALVRDLQTWADSVASSFTGDS